MFISVNMAIPDLIELMGTSHTLGQPPRKATAQQANDLRDLLVRDFDGQDTDGIDGGKWMLYCLAVDPEEQDSVQ
jgi:hypothetical protein